MSALARPALRLERWPTSIADRLALDARLLDLRTCANQIRRIQIVFTGNANQREQ
jgi:hypothetical protein